MGSRVFQFMKRSRNSGRIYPFYILHQTVIVILAFYVVQTSDTILMKFGFLCAASFLVTIAIYHFGIRPYNPLRFLFGMKPRGEP